MEMCALASTLWSVHMGCLHKLVLHLFCLLCARFRLHLTLSSECVSLLVTFPTFWRIVWLGGRGAVSAIPVVSFVVSLCMRD